MAHRGPFQQFTETCLACGNNVWDTDECVPLGKTASCSPREKSAEGPILTLEDRVRKIIGDGGPQLESAAYEYRIDQELKQMNSTDLLRLISLALEDIKNEH